MGTLPQDTSISVFEQNIGIQPHCNFTKAPMKTYVASLLISSAVYAFRRTLLFCPKMEIEASYKFEPDYAST